MRQVASHVKDGRVVYFVADTDQGELTEFATIVVPDSWGAQQSIMLGFNLIAAIGLTSAPKPAPAPARTTVDGALPAASPSRQWLGTPSAIEYIRANPGARIPDMAQYFRTTTKAVASAVTRGSAAGDIIRRNGALYPANGSSSIMDTMTPRPVKAGVALTKKGTPRLRARAEKKEWNVTVEQVADYIQAHPSVGIAELAEALLGSATKPSKQVISNRIMVIVARADKGEGPRLDKQYVSNPRGGVDIVQYRFVTTVPPIQGDIPSPFLDDVPAAPDPFDPDRLAATTTE